MRKPANIILIGFLALTLATGRQSASGSEAIPALTPLQQARETDQVLRKLNGPVPPLSRTGVTPVTATGALTSVTTAAAATSATTATTGQRLLTKSRLRPTTATVILRRAGGIAPTLAASGATTGALAATPAPTPAVPDLARMLAEPVAPQTTATQADAIPRLDPAWLSHRQNAPATPPPAPVPTLRAGAVNVNTADAGALRLGLQLDAVRARAIIQFRMVHGTFKGPEDLAQVSGITGDMVTQWDEQDLLIFK